MIESGDVGKKVGVIGSRTFNIYNLMKSVLDTYPIGTIISGGAKGADKLAERYAIEKGLGCIVHYPNYMIFGSSATYIRNTNIVEDSDFLIAFWDGKSAGTKMTIDIAEKKNKDVIIIKF